MTIQTNAQEDQGHLSAAELDAVNPENLELSGDWKKVGQFHVRKVGHRIDCVAPGLALNEAEEILHRSLSAA